MNQERAKEMWPIIKAFAEGKAIQCRLNTDRRWLDCSEYRNRIALDDGFEYRIKQEPREFWIAGTVILYHRLDAESLKEKLKYSNPYKTEVIHVREVIE